VPEPGSVLCPDQTVPVLNAPGNAYCEGHGGNPQLLARGTYCHFDLTTQTDMAYGLRQVVQQIRDRVAGCSYVVPVPPPPMS